MRSFFSLLAVFALAGCSLFHSPPANAGTLTATWDNPTTNTDGTPIPDTGPESLQTWRIEYGTCSAPGVFGVKAGELIRTRVVGGPPLTTVTNNLAPGNTCIRVFVANAAGNESTPSNVASKVIDAATPRAPTNVR